MKKTEMTLYRNKLDTCLIHTDRPESYNGNEQESLEFFGSMVRPGDLVFDVGANIGIKTNFYLACGTKVVCFEPLPPFIQELRDRFTNNPRVQIEQTCLGPQEAQQEMYICSMAPNISTLSKGFTQQSRFSDHGYQWDQKIMVPVTTLDRMIEKYGMPQFCKIDVENFEYEVLKGLNQLIPLVSLECNTDQLESTRLCIKYLTGLGYTSFNFAPAERGYFFSSQWLSEKEFFAKMHDTMGAYDFTSIWGLWGDIYARV